MPSRIVKKTLRQNSPTGRDLNPGPSEYEAGMPPPTPTHTHTTVTAAGWILQLSLLISDGTCSERAYLNSFSSGWVNCVVNLFSSITQQPLVDQGRLIVDASRSHCEGVVSPLQRPLPDFHKRQASMSSAAFEPDFSLILISSNRTNRHWDPTNTLSVENSCP